MRASILVFLFFASCAKAPTTAAETAPSAVPKEKRSKLADWRTLSEQLERPKGSQTLPGEDDGSTREMIASVIARDYGSWRHIPAPEGAHPNICDLAWFGDAVWASFGNKTISTDGALVYSWRPDRGWKLELDWDRGGAPGVTHEQGGQGISRLRVIDETLYATDADAPNFSGFGITSAPLEGYVFVATKKGFEDLRPGNEPPANTILVPLAFHVFDITRYRGRLVATGGTLSPPDSRSRYPGGLFVEDESTSLLLPRFFPGSNARAGVVRATFLHRYRGRLYVGFQNNEGRMKWDLGVLARDPLEPGAELILGRVTDVGGWKTRRFASDERTLYWIASNPRKKGTSTLFQSADGLSFTPIDSRGVPQDVLAASGTALVLTDQGLFRRQGEASIELVSSPESRPFVTRDGFCSVPMIATPLGPVVGSSNGQGIFIAAEGPSS